MNYKMDKSFHNSSREQVDGSACRALAGQAQRHEFKPLPPHTASCTSVTPVFLRRDGRCKQQTLRKPEASNAGVCAATNEILSQTRRNAQTHTRVCPQTPRTLALTHLSHKDQKIKNTNFLKVLFISLV